MSDNSPNSGRLVFQEGKRFHGFHYVASLTMHDVGKSLRISLVGLDVNEEYSSVLTYEEFDELFKFQPSLLSASMLDTRLHHLIERMDLGWSDDGKSKTIIIQNEPTRSASGELNLPADSPCVIRSYHEAGARFKHGVESKRPLVELMIKQRLAKVSIPIVESYTGVKTWKDRHTGLALSSSVNLPATCKKQAVSRSPVVPLMEITNLEPSRIDSDVQCIPSIFDCAITDFDAQIQRASLAYVSRLSEMKTSMQLESNVSERKDALCRLLRERWIEQGRIRKLERDRGLQLDRQREMNVKHKHEQSNVRLITRLREFKSGQSLERKRRQYRIGVRRHDILTSRQTAWMDKQTKRRNIARINAFRDRNIVRKLEVRERRLNERKWRMERDNTSPVVSEPKISSSASVIESVKSAKTTSSLSQAKTLKIQEDLLREKTQFLSELEREERIHELLKHKQVPQVKKTRDQIEIDKITAWKQEADAKRLRILNAKAALQTKRQQEFAMKRQHRIHRKDVNDQLQARRMVAWATQDTLRGKEVVNRAFERAAYVDSLLTSLQF